MGPAHEPLRDRTPRPIDPLLAAAGRPVDIGARGSIGTAVIAHRGHRRLRRLGVAALVVVLLTAPITYSYARALTGPGHDSMAARSVEWLRDHRMGWLVDTAERRWFATHQAKVGGTPDADVLTPPAAAYPDPASRHAGRAGRPAAGRADHERRAADVGRPPGGAPRPAAASPVTFADPLPR